MIQMPDRQRLTRLAIEHGAKELGRRLPGFLFSKISTQSFTTVEIPSIDPVFDHMNDWAATQPWVGSSRRLRVHATDKNGDMYDPDDDEAVVHYHPAPGTYRFVRNGHIIWMTRKEPDKFKLDLSHRRNSGESIELRVLGRSLAPIRSLIDEACSAARKKQQRSLMVYYSKDGWWERFPPQTLRKLESVILPEGQRDAIIADAGRFMERREWYAGMGIPYRRGYLLHGVPGSGKTSLVLALASHYNLPVYMLSLSSGRMDDVTLAQALGNLPQPSILMLEDVDAIFAQREGDSRVSFSGLLNALDGASASQGRLLFMTTNHKEQLDPALIRPGRVDYQIEFHVADADQGAELFLRFFPEATAYAEDFGLWVKFQKMTMAELQEFLLNRSDDIGQVYRDSIGEYA